VLLANPREKLKTKCPKDYQLLICQPIRDQNRHIGFQIHLNSHSIWSKPH